MSMLGRSVKILQIQCLSLSLHSEMIGLSITCTRAKISGSPSYSAFFSIAFKLFSVFIPIP